MNALRGWWTRLERERSSILIVVFSGIQAFLIVAVATRRLPATEAAVFLVSWSALNTLALAVFGPVEAMAPAMAHAAPDSSGQVPDPRVHRAFVGRFYLVAGVVTVLLAPVLTALLTGSLSGPDAVAAALFLFAYSIFSLFRSKAFGSDRIPRAAAQAALALVLWLSAIAIALACDSVSVALLILTAAISFGVSTLLLSARQLPRAVRRRRARQRAERGVAIRSLTIQYLHVAGSGLTMMIPPAIGLLLAAQIGAPAAVIVSYGGAVVLARGAFVGLGALSTSFTVRYAVYRRDQDVAGYRRLFRYHTALLVGVVLSACLGAIVAGGTIIALYTGQPFALSPVQLVAVILGEGIVTIAVIPRIVMITENRPGPMNLVWAMAAALSIAVMFLPIDPVLRLVTAPLVAGGFACLLLFPIAIRNSPSLMASSR